MCTLLYCLSEQHFNFEWSNSLLKIVKMMAEFTQPPRKVVKMGSMTEPVEFSTDLKKIQSYAVDVTLDPDTAHACLVLSEDRKEVRMQVSENIRHDLPNNPERFDLCPSVLGKEGFSSGRIYFEVQVTGKTDWDLGVATESINRKGNIILSPKNGYWTIGLWRGNDYQASACPSVPLSPRIKPQTVGVFVDYEEGLVSFYDVESWSQIYSYTGQCFAEKLYPYFYPGKNKEDKMPLIISTVSQSE
nr:E3 ubiquitin-protein ligase TRIM39-like [Misgurnus anguillicaudatus]XP_055055625.1 E3 ubiquitin-protein ligase TRIM39-like [Misgurnus anguillicaudatus]